MKNIVCLLLLFASCSPMKIVYTKTTDSIDFNKYKTFSFYELKASGDTTTKNFIERTNILKNAIIGEMNKRGYLQTSTNPDLLINIGIVVRQQTNFRTDATKYIGQQNYSLKSDKIIAELFKEGAVTLDIVDASQNSVVWKGTIEGIVPSNKSSLQKMAESGMKKLFKKYPVEIKK
ncbi:hypothetical protein GALL_124170 [mine drainage metagenome]|uniref:DUF4136 domain-containing protein n=1 Tax=mine drainage metagenome TaxID=410659 RepID=A0A1J5SZE8_9ZZZZ